MQVEVRFVSEVNEEILKAKIVALKSMNCTYASPDSACLRLPKMYSAQRMTK